MEALKGGALVTLSLEVRCVLVDKYANWKDDGTTVPPQVEICLWECNIRDRRCLVLIGVC